MSVPMTYNSLHEYFNGGGWPSYCGGYRPSPSFDSSGGRESSFTYYDAYDQFVMRCNCPGDWTVRFDANLIDNSAGSIAATNYGLSSMTGFAMGEWNRTTGAQKVYGSGYSNVWTEIDLATMTKIGTVYGSVFGPSGCLAGGAPSYCNNGYWDSSNAVTSQGSEFIFFESLGYALIINGRCCLTAYGGFMGNVMVKIDLTTGQAVDYIPTFVTYRSAAATQYESGQFQNYDIWFLRGQFVGDDDTTLTEPKGYLFLHSYNGSNQPRWIKVVDWNPSGKEAEEGTPNRIHLRERLISKFLPLVGTWPDHIPSGAWRTQPVRAVRTSGQWTVIAGKDSATYGDFSAGDIVEVVVGSVAEPAVITPPSAIGIPKTNATAIFSSVVIGDLGEKCSGIPVTYTLERISEYRELLATTGTPDEIVTVAHPPIDENSTVAVYKDGSPMTQGTGSGEWEIDDAAAGDIKFHSPETVAGHTYEALYRHAEIAVAGAWGNLLTPAARSDDDGIVQARIKYDDDDTLVGMWDKISVETEA